MRFGARVIGLLFMALLVGLPSAWAANTDGGRNGGADTGNVYLNTMDPLSWTVMDGGAWAKMSYHFDQVAYKGQTADKITSYEFNGHGLTPGAEYSLLYGNDLASPAVPSRMQLLSQGVVNNGGNLHLDTGQSNPITESGQLWLVLSSDWSQGTWTKWQPAQYLFSQGQLFSEPDKSNGPNK